MNPLTIGADPEFFVQDMKGKHVPIVGLLGGTKDKPLPVKGAPKGFAIQEDNVMAEYNIPPTDDSYEFANNIMEGRNFAMAKLQENGHRVMVSPNCSVLFSPKQLDSPQAMTFGCSPDFDAYQKGAAHFRINPTFLVHRETGEHWRFAGGHVHLGYHGMGLGWQPPEYVVAALCDAFISIPMIAMGQDPQGERRKHYGNSGRYRPTQYGIEYRTLGNYWTMTERNAVRVAQCAQSVGRALRGGEKQVRCMYNDLPWIDIRRAIDSENVALAADLNQFISNIHMEEAA